MSFSIVLSRMRMRAERLAFQLRRPRFDEAAVRTVQCAHLEPRILMSVSPAIMVVHAMEAAVVNGAEDERVDVQITATDSADQPAVNEAEVTSRSRELVIIDGSVDDYKTLLNDIIRSTDQNRDLEYLLLNPEQDGIAQITSLLRTRTDVDAIHIVSHGTDGSVQLGNQSLNSATLTAYAGEISKWNLSLTADADILLYGCNLAAGSAGQELLAGLSALTGADVAASDNVTGHTALGGDWDLEFQIGDLSTQVVFSSIVQQSWVHTLPVNTEITVDTTSDVVDGDTSSIDNLILNEGADNRISLREAILAANATVDGATPDRILFDISGPAQQTIVLQSALPIITDAVVIDATSDPDFSGTPVIKLDGINVGGDGLNITAGNSTIRGFVIGRFGGEGIRMSGTGGNTIESNYIGIDFNGAAGIGNVSGGITIVNSAGNRIGGVTAAQRNVVSGNGGLLFGDGIEINGAGSTGNIIAGNYIGTNATGTNSLANSYNGIYIANGASNNVVGGSELGAGNVISGNSNDGIEVTAGTSQNNVITGNKIGVAVNGVSAISNGGRGIWIEDAPDTRVGGTGVSDGNIISGNSLAGIGISGSNATDTVVHGNRIGTDVTGTVNLANSGGGVTFSDRNDTFLLSALIGTPHGNTIGGVGPGESNLIAFNIGAGIALPVGTGNSLRGNVIRSNTGLGIDLQAAGVTANDAADTDAGANGQQNFPVLTAAENSLNSVTIRGTINSAANATMLIDFYRSLTADSSGFGEANQYVGSTTVVTDATGNANFVATFAAENLAIGEFVCATVTDAAGNTSEFSRNIVTGQIEVTTTADVSDGDTSSIIALYANKGADGKISLREALAATNNTANGGSPDQIRFAIANTDARHFYYRNDGIAGSLSVVAATALNDSEITDFDPDYPYIQHSWFSIDLNNALPELTIRDAVVIDGYSQSGSSANTLAVGSNASLRIELTNSAADSNRGLLIQASGSGSTIQGMVINDFGGLGVLTDPDANNNTFRGNFIGTDVTSTKDRGNTDSAIQLRSGGNLIGGASVADRNVLSGNDSRGISTFTFGPITSGNAIRNNYIGVDATGVRALSNGGTSGIQVLGTTGLQIVDNVISANTDVGIRILNYYSTGTVIQGNLIGVGADGITALGNAGGGIFTEDSDSVIGGTQPGQANTIANNATFGVAVVGGTGNAIRGNNISGNDGVGINLGNDGLDANDDRDGDAGPNDRQNSPVILTAEMSGSNLILSGSFNSTPNTSFMIDVYASSVADPSGFGEGERYLGTFSVATDGNGNATISNTFVNAAVSTGMMITAAATDDNGNTSEFSNAIAVTVAQSPISAVSDSNAAANSVAEGAAIGSVVGITAVATDPDPGDVISYSLIDDAGGLFAIDSVTGIVTVAGTIDFETSTSHTIVVRARSLDLTESTASFVISVADINERPTISLTPVLATLVENASTATPIVVATFSISDDAIGTNTVTLSGTDASLFEISGNNIRLKAGSLLDFETNPGLNVTVNVDDPAIAGSPDSSAGHSVSITNVNERPTITLTPVVVTLAENSSTAAPNVVATFSISDDAIGTNTVTLSGTDTGLFEISGNNIRLKAGSLLDFETNPVLDLTVNVDDPAIAGSPDSSASHVVSITNVNERPTITLTPVVVTLTENANTAATVVVATFDVSDDALGTNAVTLSGADASLFEISGSNIQLKAGSVLDFETRSHLDFTVQVDDDTIAGTPDSHASHVVSITNINELPTLALTADVTVREDISSGTRVVQAFGSDPDFDTLSYSIIEGNIGDAFSILADGTIHVEHQLKASETSVYQLTVEVKDNGQPALSSTSRITIHVEADSNIPDGVPSTSASSSSGSFGSSSQSGPTGNSSEENASGINGNSSGGSGNTSTSPSTASSTSSTQTNTNSGNAASASSDLSGALTLSGGSTMATVASTTPSEAAAQALAAESSGLTNEAFLEIFGETESATASARESRASRHRETSSNEQTTSSRARSEYQSSYDKSVLWNNLGSLRNEIETMASTQYYAAASAIGVTSSMSVGYVMWIIRGGWLASSILTQMPAWRLVDPLVVLSYLEDDAKNLASDGFDEDDSIEAMLQKNEKAIDGRLKTALTEESFS